MIRLVTSAPFPVGPTADQQRERRRRHARRRHAAGAGSGVGQPRSEINVTPLVDVVLVLLIIFMVVTPLLHRGVPVELPETAHHARKNDTGRQLVVSVTADGVYVEADRLDAALLDARLRHELRVPTRAVHVRADRALNYGSVRTVLDALHEAGASVVGMGSEERR
jgi:biopolymer transport protein TolR